MSATTPAEPVLLLSVFFSYEKLPENYGDPIATVPPNGTVVAEGVEWKWNGVSEVNMKFLVPAEEPA